MTLETGSRIQDLVATNPVGATDFVSQGDDHIRLLKACIKGSFPSLGASAVSATADELNFVAGVTSAIQTQLDARQPLDADLTAIAAVATQAFGRSLLAAADAAGGRTLLDVPSNAALTGGYQPLDSDLTAVAALTTTAYGRGFLDLADLAATATKINALVPTWSGTHKFTGTVNRSVAATAASIGTDAGGTLPSVALVNSSAPTDCKIHQYYVDSSGALIAHTVNDGLTVGTQWLKVNVSAGAIGNVDIIGGVTRVNDAGTMREAGFRGMPVRSIGSSGGVAQSDGGKIAYLFAGITLDLGALADETIITVLNPSNASTLHSSSGTLYWFNGSGALSTGDRTLAIGGVATLYRKGADWFVWGNGLS